MLSHGRRRIMMDASMTRQYPLEFISQELLHRPRLLSPRVPASAAKRDQRIPIRRPRQMVAGKKKFVAIEQNHVATRVAGNGNRQQITINFKWLRTTNYGLDTVPVRPI